jgi:hypothetical protein
MRGERIQATTGVGVCHRDGIIGERQRASLPSNNVVYVYAVTLCRLSIGELKWL